MTYGFPPGGSGGAAAFVELDDVPNTYEGSGQRAVVVNDAGSALVFTGAVLVTDAGDVTIEAPDDSGVTIRQDGHGGVKVWADGPVGVHIRGQGDGGVRIQGDGNGGVVIGSANALLEILGPGGARLDMEYTGRLVLNSGTGGEVQISAGDVDADEAAGGDFYLRAGGSTGSDSESGTVYIQGGYGNPSNPSALVTAGDVVIKPGRGRDADGTTHGAVRFEAFDRPLADANNGQAVTYGAAVGPGGAAISIKRWLPVTVDGNEGWIPHFGV